MTRQIGAASWPKVSEYQGVLDGVEALNTEITQLAKSDEQASNSEAKYRSLRTDTLSRLKEIFAYVCRGLLGNRVKASLALSGQGLQTDVEVGGMAMESLKAIAFELAALLMSVEGRTMLPALLIHDSPREADLGEALFQCAGISRAFQIYCAVASESSIGANYVQVVDVAVVNTTHLLTKLRNVGDLRGIFIWLDRKEYLPVEGIHFKKADTEDTIGPWTLNWYGLSDLVENYRTAV